MQRLLIANRGEIACRIARSAAARGLDTVAVFSDPDASSPHVAACDLAVHLPGATASATYLDASALIDAAHRTGSDAVHPGYGFLAENATFAAACAEAGLVFVGPAPQTIADMGDKIRAKALMAEVGVPVLSSVEVAGSAAVDVDALVGAVGLPLMVKAAAGGGGKGMRVVRTSDDLVEAVAAAQREAAGAFGDARVFCEPYLERPRHIEVQILGDHHGGLVHLGERDCSLQRRHQKVIEESPAPGIDDDLRERLHEAALAAGRALGYASAGTVEFIVSRDGRPAFCEINTRLQVEHPVTEAAWRVCGRPIDLVDAQLRIADGEALGFDQDDVACVGHAVEARVYAEDPATGFLPATGRLAVWDPPGDSPGVRVDDGVAAGQEISTHYDPMLAKVIGSGTTRGQATGRLVRALRATRVHGVTTNREALVALLTQPAFGAGDVHTGFIADHLPGDLGPTDATRRLLAIAAALSVARDNRAASPVLGGLPHAWRNNPSQPQWVDLDDGSQETRVAYQAQREGSWEVTVEDRSAAVTVHGWPSAEAIDLEVDGIRARVRVARDGDLVCTDTATGSLTWRQVPRFRGAAAEAAAGGLVAPMPGTVLSVHVGAGDHVDAGELCAVIEAMKMEHRVTAPEAGRVSEVHVAPGDGVTAGAVLLVVEPGEA